MIQYINKAKQKMDISINHGKRSLPLKLFILFIFSTSLTFVKCQVQQEKNIKILGQVYAHLPQISEEQYSIVPLIVASSQANPTSSRFVAKRSADYFVVQAASQQHQATRYKFIKGKNIFTPSYINSQILESTDQNIRLETDIKKENQKTNKKTLQTEEQKKTAQTLMPKNTQQKKQQQKQQSKGFETKSEQIYSQFKNIEALRQKNLRENNKSQSQVESTKNLYKIIGYIVIGLVLSFAILKRATKTHPSLPKANQQRSELRLRDTPDDQDEDDASSSQSD